MFFSLPLLCFLAYFAAKTVKNTNVCILNAELGGLYILLFSTLLAISQTDFCCHSKITGMKTTKWN
jgi:hypothetical protein